MKGKYLFDLLTTGLLQIHIILLYCRTLDITKMIMRDKLFVHNKSDEPIDLSKEGKLENVSSLSA